MMLSLSFSELSECPIAPYMSDSANLILQAKNQWLVQQVEVEFPTKESLAGRQLYIEKASYFHMIEWPPASLEDDREPCDIEIHKADFHRLTVMFALLQSTRWSDQNEQALIVEFLTQIIFSPPCDLYVGFVNGEISAAAIVTKSDETALVSDIVTTSVTQNQFLAALMPIAEIDPQSYSDVFVETANY
ncbi:flavodoxin [Vibrio ostreicida]|uniref:flavodoxin n=1 Tax=Vibrio ostreicida TaxID=526588 RepID=UPI003B590FBC